MVRRAFCPAPCVQHEHTRGRALLRRIKAPRLKRTIKRKSSLPYLPFFLANQPFTSLADRSYGRELSKTSITCAKTTLQHSAASTLAPHSRRSDLHLIVYLFCFLSVLGIVTFHHLQDVGVLLREIFGALEQLGYCRLVGSASQTCRRSARARALALCVR